MIIVMSPNATEENLVRVQEKVEKAGLRVHLSTGEDRTIVGVIGDKKKIANLEMNMMEGVEKTVRITEKYKLVSRDFQPEDTIVDVGGVKIGGDQLVIMAGPCAVESMEQLREAAECVSSSGEVPSSPAPLPMIFRVWRRKAWKCSAQRRMNRDSRSSRKSWIMMISS